jgi:hypothetical protein
MALALGWRVMAQFGGLESCPIERGIRGEGAHPFRAYEAPSRSETPGGSRTVGYSVQQPVVSVHCAHAPAPADDGGLRPAVRVRLR